MRLKRLAVLLASALLAGCAGLAAPSWQGADAEDAACLRALAEHDAGIARAGTGDAEAARIEGFSFLRIDRHTAALAPRAATSDEAFDLWLQRLRALDDEARAIEARAAGAPAPACAHKLVRALRSDRAARSRLIERAQVPERYNSAARVAGLYPLTRIPFFAGVQAWQRDQTRAVREAAARPRPMLRVGPGPAAAPGGVPTGPSCRQRCPRGNLATASRCAWPRPRTT